MDAQRERSLDVGRTVANYLIVLLHAWGAAIQYADPSSAEGRTWTFVGVNACAGLFALFLISGHLLFRGFSLAAWPAKMARRLRRLAVPYVLWNALFVALYLGAAQLFPRVQERVGAFALSTPAGAFARVLDPFIMPLDVPLWFMRTIFVFAIFAPLLWLFLRHRVGRWIGLAAVVGLWLATDVVRCLPDCPAYRSSALAVFYVGGLLAVLGRRVVDVFRSPGWLLVGAAGFAFDLAEAFGCGSVMEMNGRLVLKSTILFHLLARAEGASWTTSGWFRKATEAAFFVYAGHFLFCSAWVHLLGPRLASFSDGRLTLLMIAFCVPGLATVFAARGLLRRVLPRTLRLFDGTL